MTSPTRVILIGGAAIAVIIGAGVWFRSCSSNPPKISPALQKSIDSAAMTKPAFDSTQRAGRQQVARDTTIAAAHEKIVVRTVKVAVSTGITADSLAAVARQAQSADSSSRAWHAAYDARTIEAQQWHTAATESDSAYQAERDARIGLGLLYGADTLRRVASEKVNAQLVAAIGKLQQPCKILFLPCPSRTASAVVGSLVTVGAVVAVRSFTSKP